jgi:PAS domain S-box-containing protein/putative nucleotidyltransferase with HDIG domain
MAKVLIVDDEKSIRATLAEFVREDGHEVRTAESAVEALRLAEADLPDVVVTDIILPRMSGVELLGRIHERFPDIQVIVITGEPTVETAAEAVRLGAFDYLAKPISSAAIRSAVARSTRIKELADDRRRLELENVRYREHLEEEVDRRGHALRESEERHRAVVENAVEGILVVQDGLIRFANPSAVTLCGYPHDVLLQTPFVQVLHPKDASVIEKRHARRLQGDDVPTVYTFRMSRGDGEIRCLELRPVRFEWDGRPATLNFVRDVTEERAARELDEGRQRRSREHSAALVGLAMRPALYSGDLGEALRIIAETVADSLDVERVEVWLVEGEEGAVTCAELFQRTSREHSCGRKPVLTDHPRYSAALRSERVIIASDARRDPRTSEFSDTHLIPLGIGALIDVAVRLGGDVVGILSVEHVGPPRAWHDEDADFVGSVSGLVSVALESAKRRRTELALEQSEMEYRALFEDSPVSLFVEDFSAVKRTFDELRACGVVDLGAHLEEYPEAVEACYRSVRVIDVNEAAVRLCLATTKDDLLLAQLAIPPVSLGPFRERLLAIWRGERLFETTALHQTLTGLPVHVALRWSIPPGQEDTLERVLLSKIDITRLVEGETRLRRALDGTIEAIGRATETRDPYTAGHQRRMTELSVALARRLGLDESVIEATRAAGLLHDIGKLSIPAEILSKPSALSPLEMSLIKTHPQSAYDVLRTIDFPWPVANIVLQHQERMDGSGYPQGLSGDAILVEARILAVADVVEAMSSHRPYRAALGVEAALAEIERGRGAQYDTLVVDACLELFRVEGFRFSSA